MPRRTIPRDRGAAAVEFAVVLQLFMLLVLGTIDWGYYFFVSEVVTNAAREGARAGSVMPTDATYGDVQSEAQRRAVDYLQAGGLKGTPVVVTTIPTIPTAAGNVGAVQVVVSYPVDSVTGFLSPIMPDYSKATAVMRWQ